MKNPLLFLVKRLLKTNQISFDADELAFQIQSHPSYPSLHSITGVLTHFTIENIAAKVPVINETLGQLPQSYIAQIDKEGTKELVLVEKSNNNYLLYDSKVHKKKISTQEFLEIFTGIIVAVEKDESKEQRNTNSYRRVISGITFSLIVIGLAALFLQSISDTVFYSLLLLSIVGVFISISIVKQEFGIQNTIGDAFCSSETEKKDCNAVLSSKGATVFKEYKLSDFSLMYFVGFTMSIVLLSLLNLSLNTMYIITLLSLPVTLYSLYYQAFLVKKWCLLCLSIVGVLWLETGVLFYFQELAFEFHLQEFIVSALGFLIVFTIWNSLKPLYLESRENKKIKLDYFKFKRKYSLFSTLLKNKTPYNTEIQNVNEIVFGNQNSNLELVVITNPFCGHCKPVHAIIEDILHQYSHQVKIVIRFNINTDNEDTEIVKITSKLLEIHTEKGKESCLEAMGDIYGGMSLKEWFQKWGECYEKEKYMTVLESEEEWCAKHKINFTPELLVNGYAFPKEYDRKDLIYFIEDLYEDHVITLPNSNFKKYG